jgi:antibiotic biosynthesis monooxygenase (ABM) superfamily enzyme
MYPHVRQLATRWPELEHEPDPSTEIRACPEPSASAGRKRPPRPAGAPRHKLALLTWAGAYAVITAILATLGPTLASWPLAVRTLVLSALMVATLTWLIMPALTRLFHAWLAPQT